MKIITLILVSMLGKPANAISTFAAATALTSQWIGLETPPIVWAAVGAAYNIATTAPPAADASSRATLRALLAFGMSCLLGALLATYTARWLGTDDQLALYGLSAFAGYGIGRILSTLLDSVLARIPVALERVLDKVLPK